MTAKKEILKPGFISHKEFEYGRKIEGYNDNCFLTEEVLTKPLYRKISIKGYKYTDIFPMSDLKLNLFCKKCMQRQWYHFAYIGESEFNRKNDETCEKLSDVKNQNRFKKMIKNFDWFYFVGKADCNHNLIVMFESIDNENVKKVGQSPSPEALNENFSKPTIDRFVKRYMQPMWEHDIEMLNNEDIKVIKKAFRKEYEKLNDQKNLNKLTVKQVLEAKEKIELLEAKAIVDVYNKIYNIPFGNPIEGYEYIETVKKKQSNKKSDSVKEWDVSASIFSLFW